MSHLHALASFVRRTVLRLQTRAVTHRLDTYSTSVFEDLLREAKQIYCTIPKVSETPLASFKHSVWGDFESRLTKYFLSERFNSSFLHEPVIGKTMFLRAGGRWQSTQLDFLRSSIPECTLRSLLRENRLGAPYITSLSTLSSHNTIHHLSHLAHFEAATRSCIASVDSIIEFGGGYGNLARLVAKMNHQGMYTIVDLPVLSCIQFAYLGSTLGRSRIHLVDKSGEVLPGRINLLPLPYLDKAAKLAGDLFISTWALSESTSACQRYVSERHFFGATRLLLAYEVQNVDFGTPALDIVSLANEFGAIRQDVPFMKNAQYLFA